MAVRNPLVQIAGTLQEIPVGDTLSTGGGSGSPAGNTNEVQYNNAGAFAGAVNVEIHAGDLNLQAQPSPTSPTAGVKLFCKNLANRMFPAFVGPSGMDATLQSNLGRNKTGVWNPPGNATTVPGVFGMPALTVVGTATARNCATTTFFTRLRRLGYVSAATAGSLVSVRTAVAQYTIGTGAGLGGFTLMWRFGCSDAATVAGARQFVGLSATTSAPTNVEPSTLINVIGIGHGTADSNLKLYRGGSAAQTPLDLGVNFPGNTLSVDMYELCLFASANNGDVGYRVERLNTGHVAEGVLTAATPGTQLPANTTLLNLVGWRCNNATALAVGLDIASIYIETDN